MVNRAEKKLNDLTWTILLQDKTLFTYIDPLRIGTESPSRQHHNHYTNKSLETWRCMHVYWAKKKDSTFVIITIH